MTLQIDYGVAQLILSAQVSHNRGKTMNELHASNVAYKDMGKSVSDTIEATPGARTLSQIEFNLDQLVDTLSSLEMCLAPVLRHLAPEATSKSGEIREAGQSPIHQSLLDMQKRIQNATQSAASMRDRVTL